MAENYSLIEDVQGYVTNDDMTKADPRVLRKGSQNILIDRTKKAGIRAGFTFALEGRDNLFDEPSSAISGGVFKTTTHIPWRMDDDGLYAYVRAYFATVDGVEQNVWADLSREIVFNRLYPMRRTKWWDAVESLEVGLFVNHSDIVYEWSGAAATVASAGTNTLTKQGTTTWAQNRFYSETLTPVGGATTQFDITNPSGTTFRYTFDGTGTDPAITATSCPVGTWVYVNGQNFSTDNNGVFLVTGSGANYFEVDNGSGVAESNKTLGTGSLYLKFKKVVVNSSAGITFGYLGGENTQTLTGVLPDLTGNLEGVNDLCVQEFFPVANVPEDGFVVDNIYQYNNQVLYTSDSDNRVLLSQDDDYTAFAMASPRIAGDGATFTLSDSSAKFGVVGKQLIIFAGDDAYIPTFESITAGSAVAETIRVDKRSFGSNQGAFSQETVIQVDDVIVFLSKEPTLRMLESVDQIADRQVKALSNPIKPDFDAEDWTQAVGVWHGSRILLHSRANSKTYILEWVETPDGGVKRYWQPPQILPIGAFAIIEGYLYGYSSGDHKSLLLFNGASDHVWDDNAEEAIKTPIDAVMKFAYNAFGKRGNLKNHDELFVEGEISQNTDDLKCTLEYDFGGATQVVEQIIDGSDLSILLESIEATSLGQQSLGTQPMGGTLSEPTDLAHFTTTLEYAKEDYYLLGITFSTNELDRQWSILAVGPNAQLSARISR